MWHNQGEWVTWRQYSILIFPYKSLVHLKCYVLIQTPSQSDIWLWRIYINNYLKIKNNISLNQYSWHPTHSPWSCHISIIQINIIYKCFFTSRIFWPTWICHFEVHANNFSWSIPGDLSLSSYCAALTFLFTGKNASINAMKWQRCSIVRIPISHGK